MNAFISISCQASWAAVGSGKTGSGGCMSWEGEWIENKANTSRVTKGNIFIVEGFVTMDKESYFKFLENHKKPRWKRGRKIHHVDAVLGNHSASAF
jgi:hypothetical protein